MSAIGQDGPYCPTCTLRRVYFIHQTNKNAHNFESPWMFLNCAFFVEEAEACEVHPNYHSARKNNFR